MKNLILRLPFIRKIVAENRKLREKNKMLFKMYTEICEKNRVYEDTLNELIENVAVTKEREASKMTQKEKIARAQKVERVTSKTVNTASSSDAVDAFTFQKEEIEDRVQKQAEKIVNDSPFGMAASDYKGEPIQYQQLTDDAIKHLLDYCYENKSKEVNIDFGNKRSGIMECHQDDSISIELYENGTHQKSIETGQKVINNHVVSDYSDEDIIDELNLFVEKEPK